METVSRYRIILFAVILWSMLFVSICFADVLTHQNSKLSADGESLRHFIQTWDDKAASYISAFCDLNDDGTPEAVVYLTDREWCGSGGCTMLILTKKGGSWSVVTEIAITQLPIRVLSKKTNGWHSIGVWVQGGGIQPGYESVLDFDGNSYPSNPTVPPARRLKKKSAGRVLIPSAKGGASQ
jgi:hypothetical protein